MTNLTKESRPKSIMHDFFQGMRDIITMQPCKYCGLPLEDDTRAQPPMQEMHVHCAEEFIAENTQN